MKAKFKWQKEFLEKINNMSDEKLFDEIHYRFGNVDRFDHRDCYKEEALVSLFRQRMGWESSE